MDSFKSLKGSFIVIVIAALLQLAIAQTNHVVGDSMGWDVPTQGGAQAYVNWAASQTFTVGDTLQFNFATGRHDVAKVSGEDFDSCNASNSLEPVIATGPATVPLTSAGDHYYICAFSGHCNIGQKVMITVEASSSPAPPIGADGPTTAPPPTAGAPMPSNSASSFGAGHGVAFVLSLVVFFLYIVHFLSA